VSVVLDFFVLTGFLPFIACLLLESYLFRGKDYYNTQIKQSDKAQRVTQEHQGNSAW